jgi:hypothetical protein
MLIMSTLYKFSKIAKFGFPIYAEWRIFFSMPALRAVWSTPYGGGLGFWPREPV